MNAITYAIALTSIALGLLSLVAVTASALRVTVRRPVQRASLRDVLAESAPEDVRDALRETAYDEPPDRPIEGARVIPDRIRGVVGVVTLVDFARDDESSRLVLAMLRLLAAPVDPPDGSAAVLATPLPRTDPPSQGIVQT